MSDQPAAHICPVTAIIVTHDSQPVIGRCLAAIRAQTARPEQVVIVDSGSQESSYLRRLEGGDVMVHCVDNIGFAAANNLGVSLASSASRYLLFLNPDAFMAPGVLAAAAVIMAENDRVGIVGGRLTGYDSDLDTPTGRLDSTGIFRSWYGRWYDRGQGQPDGANYRSAQTVPALCGAFLFCRRRAVEPELPQLFDEDFFLYKEDIDLCLRIRRRGWQCRYEPTLTVFHCRGWSADRKKMSRGLRLMAARNEVRLTVKHRSPYIAWALAKYLLVRAADL